ncbi:MAG: VacB/RNase II family 3'-5' exoribonuclease [Parvularculales bacterium]
MPPPNDARVYDVKRRRQKRSRNHQKKHQSHSRSSSALAPVTVIIITGETEDGDLLAAPARWYHDDPPPILWVSGVISPRGRMPSMERGDKAVARIMAYQADHAFPLATPPDYEARIIRCLNQERHPEETHRMGVFRQTDDQGGRLAPIVKGDRQEIIIPPDACGDAQDEDLVLVEITSEPSRYRRRIKQGRVLAVRGAVNTASALSLIALEQHNIPVEFPDDVLAEAAQATLPDMTGREDLCNLDFITIDPQDARDHDDALWVTADDDPTNAGGWRAIVAIADVAALVTPDSALDREAARRGNSVYFPDRVVPMFPERLSTDLCSLKAHNERPSLAAHLIFDARGILQSHHFTRAIIKPAARLTYTQVQNAINGSPDATTKPLVETTLKPLWAAWSALDKARQHRQPLDLELPEYRITLDDVGSPTGFEHRTRLEAHRLVEEFMIAANVAAAETLTRKKIPALYRIHEAPTKEKLDDLELFLRTLGIKFNQGTTLKPAQFNTILTQTKDGPFDALAGEIILRAQSQAIYSPLNLGHFGLNLRRYIHFTSPIRRYADLVVHRALIQTLSSNKTPVEEPGPLADIAEHISQTERRAMAAERDTLDRYRACFMEHNIGHNYEARITGVTRAGLFVRLENTGGDGLVPIRRLKPSGFYRHDETRNALFDKSTRYVFQTGMSVTVQVIEVAPFSGGVVLDLIDGGERQSWAKNTAKQKHSRRKYSRRRN